MDKDINNIATCEDAIYNTVCAVLIAIKKEGLERTLEILRQHTSNCQITSSQGILLFDIITKIIELKNQKNQRSKIKLEPPTSVFGDPENSNS